MPTNQRRRVPATRLTAARMAALVFAVAFSGWSIVTLLLVLTINVARMNRLGFAAVTGAAALALWTVYWLIAAAIRPDGVPGRIVSARRRILDRLRTPRH